MYGLTEFVKSNARAIPKACATKTKEGATTWSEFEDRVARLASALRELGVADGERAAILALNSHRYLEYFFAVWWAGGAVVPLNVRWSATENAYSLNDSGSKILFVDRAFAPMIEDLRSEVESLETVIYLDDGVPPQGTIAYEDLIGSSAPCADAGRSGKDLAGLYYTGGTTGFPKGVMLSHEAIWFNNSVCGTLFQFRPGDVLLHAAPMFHLADGSMSGGATAAGVAHVFVPAFEPLAVMRALAEHKVTHAVLVPTMWDMILNHPEFDPACFETVREALYGASPMPKGLLQQIIDILQHVKLTQGYGQTEMGPVISLLLPDSHNEEGAAAGLLSSAGKACVGVEVSICDEDGNDVPNGEVGEIVARSPGSMTGYWNMPEATEATLNDGWVKTGDGAYRNDEGFLFIVDRIKDMIVTGGENVFSAEVESCISTHPEVAAVAVIGMPSEKWGEEVHAIIIPMEGAEPNLEGILTHLDGQIANYKRPRSLSIRHEPFPLSGTGKVLKRDLRAPFWEGQTRNVS
ncbi:MAG: long-chain-fatty-acid--CoA ligase [Pseudomonadota bacterium]